MLSQALPCWGFWLQHISMLLWGNCRRAATLQDNKHTQNQTETWTTEGLYSFFKHVCSDRIQQEPAPWQCSWACGRWPTQPRTPPSRSYSSGNSQWSQTKGCHGWWQRDRRQHLQQRVGVHALSEHRLTATGLLTRPRSHPAVYWRSWSACSRQRETWGQTWWTCWAFWWRQDGHSSWGDTTGPRHGTGQKKGRRISILVKGHIFTAHTHTIST